MPRSSLISFAPIVIAFAFLLASCASARPQEPVAACPDVASTGQLNVLTLNLLYDAPASIRQKTWTDIAQFAITHNVHVLLLQEAVLSDVDRIQDILGTSDSARDLQRVLNQRSSEPYELRAAWETGIPLVLTTANAILSRCDITRHFSAFLPIESEEAFEGIDFKLTRNVQVAQLNPPGYGPLRLYNTHLCADCSVDSLQPIIILQYYLSTSFIISKEQSLKTAENNINLITTELNTTTVLLEENTSELKQLQSGNRYNLHDPLYEGACSFMENDSYSAVNITINKAKNMGLRCALVQVIMGKQLNMYELISFNTVDNKTICFEPKTDYQVTPQINQKYINCTYDKNGDHPYKTSRFNDTIVDILTFW